MKGRWSSLIACHDYMLHPAKVCLCLADEMKEERISKMMSPTDILLLLLYLTRYITSILYALSCLCV